MRARFSAKCVSLSMESADAIQRFRPLQQSLARLLQFTLIVGEPDVSYGELHAAYSKLGFDRIPRQLLLRECGLVGMTHIAVANHLARDHGDDKNNAERRSDREFGADLQILDEARHGRVSRDCAAKSLSAAVGVDRPCLKVERRAFRSG